MKIAVFGAAGMLGSAIVSEGRSRGHEIVSVSTRPGAGDVVASIEDTDAVVRLAKDVDAVVVSVPPARSTSAEAWLAAHERLAATPLEARLFMVGGAGSSLDANGRPLLEGEDFPADFRPEAEAASTALAMFRNGSPEPTWTIVSPAPVLAPGERTGHYETSDDHMIGVSVSSQDLAVAIIDELENPRHSNKRFVVSN